MKKIPYLEVLVGEKFRLFNLDWEKINYKSAITHVDTARFLNGEAESVVKARTNAVAEKLYEYSGMDAPFYEGMLLKLEAASYNGEKVYYRYIDGIVQICPAKDTLVEVFRADAEPERSEESPKLSMVERLSYVLHLKDGNTIKPVLPSMYMDKTDDWAYLCLGPDDLSLETVCIRIELVAYVSMELVRFSKEAIEAYDACERKKR